MSLLVHYDAKTETLTGSQRDKAIKFFDLDLIEQISPLEFRINPIKGYNKTAYSVTCKRNLIGVHSWKCNCQFHKTTEKTCSHILAVKIFLHPDLLGVLR